MIDFQPTSENLAGYSPLDERRRINTSGIAGLKLGNAPFPYMKVSRLPHFWALIRLSK
jgi:hypothetical protein